MASSVRAFRALSGLARLAKPTPSSTLSSPSVRGLATLTSTTTRTTTRLTSSSLFNNTAPILTHAVPASIASPEVSTTTNTTTGARGMASGGAKTGVVEASDETLESLTKSGRVVIDFSATWCGPCKFISPFFGELSNKYKDSGIKFVNVDVDDAPEASMKYKISAVPTFAFVENGKLVDQIRGADAQGLERKVQAFAASK